MPNNLKIVASEEDNSGKPMRTPDDKRPKYNAPSGNKPTSGKVWLLALLAFVSLIGGAMLVNNINKPVSAKGDVSPPPLPVNQSVQPLPTTAKSEPVVPSSNKGNGNSGQNNHTAVVEGNHNSVGNTTNITNNITIINGSPTTSNGATASGKPGANVTVKADVCDVEAEKHKVRVEGWKKDIGSK
jgi:hypothetical protein